MMTTIQSNTQNYYYYYTTTTTGNTTTITYPYTTMPNPFNISWPIIFNDNISYAIDLPIKQVPMKTYVNGLLINTGIPFSKASSWFDGKSLYIRSTTTLYNGVPITLEYPTTIYHYIAKEIDYTKRKITIKLISEISKTHWFHNFMSKTMFDIYLLYAGAKFSMKEIRAKEIYYRGYIIEMKEIKHLYKKFEV